MDLKEHIYNYVRDPKNPQYNFQLGWAYETLAHTASAAGFYLRTTEFSRDDLLTYEALLRMALCFEIQGNRMFTVTGLLMRAISLIPDRPEAYFLLARIFEHTKAWQESYTWSILGEKVAERASNAPLRTHVQYPGSYGFRFERAVSSWWIGLYDESMFLFRELKKNPLLDFEHARAVSTNLEQLDNTWKKPLLYQSSDYERLRIKFKGAQNVRRNFSQCYQDMFVLTMLDGKRNGSYLEIGCGDPWYGNNTALLEEMGWKGWSVDISQEAVNLFKKERKGKVVCVDATKMKFDPGSVTDYLQIDCDPAQTSLQVLLNIPFDEHSFRVITFEHDHYRDESNTVRDRSRLYLESCGYVLVLRDVSVNQFDSFEDWWVHPDLLPENGVKLIEHFSHYNNDPNEVERIMFN